MTIREMQREILRLKEERDVFVLAHSYERKEVTEVADVVGDSFRLACAVEGTKQKTVLLCGVRFMAETVKILAPQKKVVLANGGAGCPMAEQLAPEELKRLQAKYPRAVTVAYVNTTAALKAECDVCVTSSSAVKVISRLPEKEILFVPDRQLGKFCEKRLPEKTFYFFEGGCPVHLRATEEDVARGKAAHPEALLLSHPECREEVTDKSDYAGSTSGIMQFARESKAKEFIIGTENTIAQALQYECPEKKFYPLSKQFICADMQLTTLPDVLRAVGGEGGEEIVINEEIRLAAKKSIDKMIALGG